MARKGVRPARGGAVKPQGSAVGRSATFGSGTREPEGALGVFPTPVPHVARCVPMCSRGPPHSGGPGGLPCSGDTGVGQCTEDLCTPWSGAGGGGGGWVGQLGIRGSANHNRTLSLIPPVSGGAYWGARVWLTIAIVRRCGARGGSVAEAFLLAPSFYSGVGPATELLVLPSPVLVAPAPSALALPLPLPLPLPLLQQSRG